MSTITLSNQASFADFFRKFAAGEITDDVSIKFEPPKVEQETPFLRVRGDEYNSTINTSVMNVLQVHQKNINRLYSLITYGKVQRLKASEAEAIKIIFQVNEGSSTFSIENIKELLEIIIMSKLTGRQIVGITVSIAVAGLFLFFTSGVIQYYLDKEYLYKDKQLNLEQSQINLEQSQSDKGFLLEQSQINLEQRKIDTEFLLRAIGENAGGQNLLDGSKEFSGKLENLSKNADVVEYSGHTVSTSSKEKKLKETLEKRLDGKYKILRLDAEHDNFFKVKIENVETGDKFNAKLDSRFIKEDDLSKISQAVIYRMELNLNVNAIFVDNKLTHAFVILINDVEETE